MAIDPICGMEVLPEEAAGSSRHKGVDYYFCAVGCKETFDRSPELYANPGQPPIVSSRPLEATPARAGKSGITKAIEIPIGGMSCASCVQRI